MKQLHTFYSDVYAPEEEPSLARLGVAARLMESNGLVELREPGPFDRTTLQGLHAETYRHAFDQGIDPLASSQGIAWSPRIRDATYAMLSGQIESASHAFSHGIAMNLARGFHHAVYERGSGFCAMNGLALVAHVMPALRVFVIDCDEHGGNGTEEFALRLPNLFNASMFGTRFGCHGNERSWPFEVRLGRDGPSAHKVALQRIEKLVIATSPDLLLYQAGTDSHRLDPKGQSGFTDDALIERDLIVFGMARRLAIPIVVSVAGGYQAAEAIAKLNTETVRCALQVYA